MRYDAQNELPLLPLLLLFQPWTISPRVSVVAIIHVKYWEEEFLLSKTENYKTFEIRSLSALSVVGNETIYLTGGICRSTQWNLFAICHNWSWKNMSSIKISSSLIDTSSSGRKATYLQLSLSSFVVWTRSLGKNNFHRPLPAVQNWNPAQLESS